MIHLYCNWNNYRKSDKNIWENYNLKQNQKNTDVEVEKLVQEYVDMQEDAVENLKKFL